MDATDATRTRAGILNLPVTPSCPSYYLLSAMTNDIQTAVSLQSTRVPIKQELGTWQEHSNSNTQHLTKCHANVNVKSSPNDDLMTDD